MPIKIKAVATINVTTAFILLPTYFAGDMK
jgi:hypothetical protein